MLFCVYHHDSKEDPTASWEHIRQLDEDENWSERTSVVTKQDHKLYIDCAEVCAIFIVPYAKNLWMCVYVNFQELVDELVSTLPVR